MPCGMAQATYPQVSERTTMVLSVTGRRALTASMVAVRLPAYLVLLRVGFTMPLVLPPTRWALTPPFHPYLRSTCAKRLAVCFLLHWPSSWLAPTVPDVIRHTALRSSDFPPPPDRLAPTEGSDHPTACTCSECISGKGQRLQSVGGYPPSPCFLSIFRMSRLPCLSSL